MRASDETFIVMAGLVPAIYVFLMLKRRRGCPGHLARRRASRFCPGHDGARYEPADQGVMVTGEKSTNQLLGCTKLWIFGLIARGPTSCATNRNAASSTEAACSSASASSRAAGSKVCRALVTSSSNLGLLMKPQLFDTGGAIDDCRKRTIAKNGSIAA